MKTSNCDLISLLGFVSNSGNVAGSIEEIKHRVAIGIRNQRSNTDASDSRGGLGGLFSVRWHCRCCCAFNCGIARSNGNPKLVYSFRHPGYGRVRLCL